MKLLAALFTTLLLVVSCSSASSGTPAPTTAPATPTATFEQKRTDVVAFLKAFNAIDNSLTATVDQIQFPTSATSAADLLALNAALTKFITAVEGARQRLAGLKPSTLEAETGVHLQKTIAFIDKARQAAADLLKAIAGGDQANIQKQSAILESSENEGSTINRATEALMLKYNISDNDVDYRSRGQ